MAKFVCPGCDEVFQNGSSSVISQAINHMRDEHGRDVSREYVEGNIEANKDE